MTLFDDLAAGRCGDPFSLLGIHPHASGGWWVRAFLPWAEAVVVRTGRRRIAMERVHPKGGWEARIPPHRQDADGAPGYRLAVTTADGSEIVHRDPYRFPPTLDDGRIRSFLSGHESRAHEFMGAVPLSVERVRGMRFAVWAPFARAVHVVGDMNGWNDLSHPMRPRGKTGVWELFLPGVESGTRYKYRILGAGGDTMQKSDPFGRFAEVRPATGSIVPEGRRHRWGDRRWMNRRAGRQDRDAPVSIYEVHAGSWRRHADGSWFGYRELADALLPYVKELGFTHVELLPLTEHPLDESWGYQPVGFFSPTSRFGTPDDLRYFVDRAHRLGLGVLLDWVPGHFAQDEHGLARFNGKPLFEPADPQRAEHPDWGTLTFDYAKGAVRSFLISSALYWLEEFHMDGLRVDAVASMLYLDYSRDEGEWTPNREGGNTNLEAADFLRQLNSTLHSEVPGAITAAEESTAWAGVSAPPGEGGLGFDYKWNMGWMNDTLDVMAGGPVHRKHHHDRLTFSMVYAYSERFILPLSHDEVVHGKRSLLGKMPGGDREKFANLRLLLGYQWTHPGKKLLFQGCELAQWTEWAVGGEVDWALETFDTHTGVRRLVADLNGLYTSRPALHQLDTRPEGFEWLNAGDKEHSTLAWLRWAPGFTDPFVVAANFTPVPREDYRVPVPHPGRYRVVLNTDAEVYGGRDAPLGPELTSEPVGLLGSEHSVVFGLPGLTLVGLERVAGSGN